MPAPGYQPHPLRSTSILERSSSSSTNNDMETQSFSALPRYQRKSSFDGSTAKFTTSKSERNISSTGKPPRSGGSRILRRRSSMGETPFDLHLQDIYAGRVDVNAGQQFFESHGYYDVSEANTVEMFRQNFGLQQFWDGDAHDLVLFDENVDTIDLNGLQILSLGALLTTKKYTRHRTTSGRFELLDDDGCPVDPATEIEAEREKRMKKRSIELDEDDLAELAQEQIVLAKAITVIRTETTRFRHFFLKSMADDSTARIPIPVQPAPTIPLPPFSGYMYILKDTIPKLFRSWHKRWFFLDFNAGLIMMYKRHNWKRSRGVFDLRTVANMTRVNAADIRIECFDGRTLMLRSKIGPEDADLWLSLLQFARRQVGNVLPPQYIHTASTALTVSTGTTRGGSSHGDDGRGATAFLISTKLRGQDRSVLDMMAMVLSAKNPITASTNNSITAA